MSDKKSNKIRDESKSEIMRIHAWDYFAFHGAQRITLFRYYITFYSIYLTGISYCVIRFYMDNAATKELAFIISLSFLIITIIFFCLDQRNRALIKLSENALKKLEDDFDEECRVFQGEVSKGGCIRHTVCFTILFCFNGIVSIGFMIWSIFSLFGRCI